MVSSKWQDFLFIIFFISSTKNFPRNVSCFRLIYDEVTVLLQEYPMRYTSHFLHTSREKVLAWYLGDTAWRSSKELFVCNKTTSDLFMYLRVCVYFQYLFIYLFYIYFYILMNSSKNSNLFRSLEVPYKSSNRYEHTITIF